MQAGHITNKQGVFLSALFLSSNCYSLLFAAQLGASVWICYFLAWFLAVALAHLLGRLVRRLGNHNVFELFDLVLPRPLSRFFISILALYAFLSACTSLSIFGQFNQLTALSKTPTLMIPLAIVLLGVFSCRAGLTAIGRVASLTVYFSAMVFLLFSALGFNDWNPSLLLAKEPVPTFELLRGGLCVFCNQFGDLILLCAILPQHSKKNPLTLGALCAGGILAVISLITVMTLGSTGVSGNAYPVFTVLSIRTVGQFLQHPELLTTVAMTFFAFFRISLSMYFIMRAGCHLFSQKDGRAPLLPIGLLLASVTQLLYHGMPMLMARLESDLSLLILSIIQIGIPLMLSLLSRKKKTLGS